MPVTRSRHENEQRQRSAAASATASVAETTEQSTTTGNTGSTGTSATTTTTSQTTESEQTTTAKTTVKETAAQTEVATLQPTPTEREQPSATRCKSHRSKKSDRTSRLARAKEKLLRLQIELAAARVAAIEAEEESDSDSKDSIMTGRRTARVTEWLDENIQPIPVIEAPPQQQAQAHQEEATPKQEPPQLTVSHLTLGALRETNTAQKQNSTTAARPEATSTVVNLNELAAAIALAAKTPHPLNRHFHELPQFSGAHQEWLLFRAAFKDSKGSYTESENIARLRRSLKGLAKEAVESLLIYGESTEEIMKTLETRFGRPDAIAVAELERLRTLPRLTDTPRDICTFATRISNIIATLRMLKKNYYLFNPEVTKAVIEKLTPALRYRWYDFATATTEDEADLVKLSRFINEEAQKCGPYAQPEQITCTTDTESKKPRTFRKQKTYTAMKQPDEHTCPVCDEAGHDADRCAKYTELDSDGRWKTAKAKILCFACLKRRSQGHRCRSKKCGIDGCQRTHHESLHFHRRPTEEKKEEVVASTWATTKSQSYLKIIPVKVSGPKGDVDTYALLDDGSTVTLVDADIAKRTGTKGRSEPLHIEAIGNTEVQATDSKRVSLTLKGTLEKHNIQAHTINKLRVAPQKISSSDIADCTHLTDIAPQLSYQEATPGILIGQDNWHLLLATETRRGRRNQPVASLTPLGWVLHGSRTRTLGQRLHRVNHLRHIEDDMNEQLRHYLAIESLTVEPKKPKGDPEQRALEMLREHTHRREDGHYETALLWKDPDHPMPQNKENALKRLLITERRIDKDPKLRRKYNEQMDALISKGYAEIAPARTEGKSWYLPHFPVINPMKPDKVRVVHDAAAKTRGVSLNDRLLTGPDLIQSLPGVIMRFRQHPIAVTADIAEMFMQVKIREADREALRYLWRGEARGGAEVTEYRMTSLIFGAKSSPATAIYVKDKNAETYKQTDPEAYRAIVKNHYVDDYLQSFKTAEEAIRTATAVRDIHRHAHYELRQWASNSPTVRRALAAADKCATHLSDGTPTERVLGLVWRCTEDELAFNLDLARLPREAVNNDAPTKREVLKILMSLFDPLGLAAPVMSRAKQLLQEIWRRGTDWDQAIDTDLQPQWRSWMDQLKGLAVIRIPRCYLHYSEATRLELHTFVDASEAAYAAALYWRATHPDGRIDITLVMAKSRVAPLKLVSIPRLELQAATMGSRMAAAVIEEHDRKPDAKVYWTDSKTVLTWLRNGARSYRPYVAHRVAAIEENSTVAEWRWVPTKMNVADDATRDVPHDISSAHRWYTGPEFLRNDPATWPAESATSLHTTGEERVLCTRNVSARSLAATQPLPERFSKWEKLLRTTARILQFIDLCRQTNASVNYRRQKRRREKDVTWKRIPDKQVLTPKHTAPTSEDSQDRYHTLSGTLLRRAERLLIRRQQEESFGAEIAAINSGDAPSHRSRLHGLALEVLDGVLLIKSRILATEEVPDHIKRPAILDGKHPITKLYMDYVHRQLLHAGVETTLNECRQRYWIVGSRPTVKAVIRSCLQCRIRKATPPHPATGDLPSCRLAHHRRPFSYTGVDYFGPLTVTVGRSTQKRYVALFTCLTTRAVHLEIAGSLTTDSAIMALRRFVARRGLPTEIWSDNGANLQGADKELRRSIDAATQQDASRRAINWRYIPPSAPFMGGAWERLVRSVKTSLAIVLRERHPSEEVLATLIAEVENIVNSRPLTHVSVDPDDPEALTPNHFLLGGSSNIAAPGEFQDSEAAGRSHWRASQSLADQFWSRWVREYLPELQHRREPYSRGEPLQLGSLVLIADGTLPRNVWPRGVVTKIFPGPDGVVRTADIRTRNNTLRRPTKKLVILPIDFEAAPRQVMRRPNDQDDARRE